MDELLERSGELAALRRGVAAAAAGRGSVVLVAGEAGIGKSALVRAWADDPGADARVRVGWCDDFLTHRALGPLHDVARRAGGALADAVAAGDTSRVLEAILEELAYPLAPTVLLLEDLHWADDATLDVVRYVGRRVRDLPAVLALTYRDDEVDAEHPLTGVLGSLSPGAVHRITLRRLSRGAVARLTAGSGLDPDEVVRITGGNPFFVTELSDDAVVPASVGDAVLARVRRLPESAQRAVEALAVVPGGADAALTAALLDDTTAVVAAERGGVLTVERDRVRFRHELARRAVLAALPMSAQLAHHHRILEHLLSGDTEPARLLHHAVALGRADVIAAHGPAAAGEAYRTGAHREAIAYAAQVLAHPELLTSQVRARLLEEHAWSLYHVQHLAEAAEVMSEAVDVAKAISDRPAYVRTLLGLARMRYLLEGPRAAQQVMHAAADELATVDDASVTAELSTSQLSLLALSGAHEQALGLAEHVHACNQQVARPDLDAVARVYTGLSQVVLGDDGGLDLLETTIAEGREARLQEPVARGFVVLVECLMLQRRWDDAARWIDRAIAFYDHHDYRARFDGVTLPCPGFRFDTLCQRALLAVLGGDWADAEVQLRSLDERILRSRVMGVLGWQARALFDVRRGADEAEASLTQAWEIALLSGSALYAVPVACAAVEWAWAAQRPETAEPYVATVTQMGGPAAVLAPLRWRLPLLGHEPDPSGIRTEPERTSLSGDSATAARRWQELRLPFEQGLELLRTGAREAALEALALFERLGAAPAAQMARRQLRDLGVTHIPRGPSSTTRANPLQLTVRQQEVLELIGEGLTNAEIADRLVVSVRTVDHHVSSVLQKLGVSSRRQAAERAAALADG